jgi:hypothetical protein
MNAQATVITQHHALSRNFHCRARLTARQRRNKGFPFISANIPRQVPRGGT